MSFQKDFVWGVATSAYQIEGAAAEDGRGPSIWDAYVKEPGRVFEGHTGEVACDHYHRFLEDVALMKRLGVKAYRFSVSWSRVLPEGVARVNEAGLRFYEQLVDALLENGITPYLTLYHWDLPYALHLRGGWLSPDSPQWFAEYAALIGRRLGDKVKHYMTFNEPQVFIGTAFTEGAHAPGYCVSRPQALQMTHHVLLAHGRAVQALRAAVPGAKIGWAPTSNARVPLTGAAADIAAAKEAYFSVPADNWAWSVAWWSDPVMLGRYPEEGLRALEADLPPIGADDLAIIHQPLDFYGQNIYRGVPTRMGADGRPETVLDPPGSPKTAIGWHVNFDCLYWGTKFLYERYKTPIYITENGMSAHDWPDAEGQVHDPQRIDYLRRHLAYLRRAAEEGVDIAGYFEWSLLDNFEWTRGYHDRFGLVYVDFATQQRIPKDSFSWYAKTIAANGENL